MTPLTAHVGNRATGRLRLFRHPFSGEAGFVFGYKSSDDYWLTVLDSGGYIHVYHVIEGTKNLEDSIAVGDVPLITS